MVSGAVAYRAAIPELHAMAFTSTVLGRRG